MRTQCNGYFCDTDTAKLVALDSGDVDPEWSNAGWHLYRTPDGAYFQVVYGHEGEEISFRTVWSNEANDLMAKHPMRWAILGQ
jgi:hypothetical protein